MPLTRRWPRRGGSSPLARGLPLVEVVEGGVHGIIPARAGFTTTITGSPCSSADHPRSRGVYSLDARGLASTAGSSPLARGLRGENRVDRATDRIIPARAGFTTSHVSSTIWAWDHPRSRGVYIRASGCGRVRLGSSPLARGLRGAPGVDFALEGIIPARAGFTLADPWNPNEPVLYQTPVAFTADLGPAPPSCGSAAVVLRWTTTPSGA